MGQELGFNVRADVVLDTVNWPICLLVIILARRHVCLTMASSCLHRCRRFFQPSRLQHRRGCAHYVLRCRIRVKARKRVGSHQYLPLKWWMVLNSKMGPLRSLTPLTLADIVASQVLHIGAWCLTPLRASLLHLDNDQREAQHRSN